MTAGLLFTSLLLGLRHGIDWDHVAAIADLSGTSQSRRRGFVLSFAYIAGHAVVVLFLGGAAIVAGRAIPESVDHWMGRVVGITLIGLGVWIAVELVRKRRDFRLRSRWFLVVSGTFAGLRRVRGHRVRGQRAGRVMTLEHSHHHGHVDSAHDEPFAHDHPHGSLDSLTESSDIAVVSAAASELPESTDQPGYGGSVRHRFDRIPGINKRPTHRQHEHRHKHELVLPSSPAAGYGSGTATGVGILHGIGIESPTQILLFTNSASVGGTGAGVALLVAWLAGLVVANTGLALLAGFGLLHAERNFVVYATVAVLISVASIVFGMSILLAS